MLEIVGWVVIALGALRAGPGIGKVVARRKTWRMPSSLVGSGMFWGLLSISIGLAMVTRALWPLIAGIVFLAAYFLLPAISGVRVRRQKER